MDSILKALTNRIKDKVPELEKRIAGYTVMPSPDKVRTRFSTKPYAAVFNTGFKRMKRDPPDDWVPAKRMLIDYSFDVALILDPGQELQDKDGHQAESLPQDIINAVQNFRHECWVFSFIECQSVGNTTSEAIYALSFCATAWINFDLAQPDQSGGEGVPLAHIKVKGTLE